MENCNELKRQLTNAKEGLALAAEYIRAVGDLQEMWATESRRDGWSTHQVDRQENLAAKCRHTARQLTEVRNALL